MLNEHTWKPDPRGYLRTSINRKTVYLHRFILGNPKGFDVDHINGDYSDNRRENLRVCTTSQNCMNQRKSANRSSIYKGVSWFKNVGKWAVQIRKEGKRHYFGYFDDEIKAAEVYNEKAKDLFGEFALLNNI